MIINVWFAKKQTLGYIALRLSAFATHAIAYPLTALIS